MTDLNRDLKKYIYINEGKINNLYYQTMDFFLKRLKYRLSFGWHGANISFETEKNKAELHRKIIDVYDFLKKKGYLFEAADNLMYNKDYYTLETQYFRKINIDGSRIETPYPKEKINIWISTNRKFSKFSSYSPLILVSDELSDSLGQMDGSSGYSIFKILMEKYLKCSDYFIRQINNNLKEKFPLEPIKFFEEIGCKISDEMKCEVLWDKRAILKDDIYHVVYTFAYPLFIARELGRAF